jgi:hypothetical protein
MSSKVCPKCKQSFVCCNETRGCWCEQHQLSKETLDLLRTNYHNCLCNACIAGFEKEQQNRNGKSSEAVAGIVTNKP